MPEPICVIGKLQELIRAALIDYEAGEVDLDEIGKLLGLLEKAKVIGIVSVVERHAMRLLERANELFAPKTPLIADVMAWRRDYLELLKMD